MKNNNNWMMWGFIVLVILNIILIGYIFMGLNKGVSLSPSGSSSGCTDTNPTTACYIGDKDGPTAVQVYRSAIIDAGADYLSIQTAEPKGVKISGINTKRNLTVNGNLYVNGSIKADNLPLLFKVRVSYDSTLGKPYVDVYPSNNEYEEYSSCYGLRVEGYNTCEITNLISFERIASLKLESASFTPFGERTATFSVLNANHDAYLQQVDRMNFKFNATSGAPSYLAINGL
ncbi:MAG: hypothetical protein WC781_03820 [Candidatus Pacearchaeota archaeon]